MLLRLQKHLQRSPCTKDTIKLSLLFDRKHSKKTFLSQAPEDKTNQHKWSSLSSVAESFRVQF